MKSENFSQKVAPVFARQSGEPRTSRKTAGKAKNPLF
jgi:hypothetical protein